MKKFIPFLVCLLALVSASASARIIGVPGDSPTIQAGIDASTPGDTVLVQPGRYLETIDFKGKDIVLGSLYITTQDTSYISKTIIDGNNINTVVTFQTGETSAAELCGFTITNGASRGSVIHPEYNSGGGICCKGASPYLHHLYVMGNRSSMDGGGMYLERSNSVIEYCMISGNSASEVGGGMGIYKGNYKVRFCIFSNNYGSGAGDGIFGYGEKNNLVILDHVVFSNNYNSIYYGTSTLDIINCTIFSLKNGEAVRTSSLNANIVNTIIWTNGKWGIYSYVDPQWPGSNIVVSHSVLKNGILCVGKGVQDSLYWLEGNSSIDPLFYDQTHDNLNLQKGSPCIDAGIPYLSSYNRTVIDLKKEQYKGVNPDIGAIEGEYSQTKVEHNNNTSVKLSSFPNPFNESTIIQIKLTKACKLNLNIYNINGQLIESLHNGNISVGMHEFIWKARNISSGIYFIELNADGLTRTNKLMLFK